MFKMLYAGPDGRPSSHKFWGNVAYMVATVAFAKITWQAMPSDGLSMLFFVYLATVGGNALANKYVDMKLGGGVLPVLPVAPPVAPPVAAAPAVVVPVVAAPVTPAEGETRHALVHSRHGRRRVRGL